MQYALEQAKNNLLHLLQPVFGTVEIEIRTPPPNVPADFAVSLFKLAKERQMSPNQLAQELAGQLDLTGSFFRGAEAAGGYLNVTLDFPQFAAHVAQDFQNMAERYGAATVGEGKTVVLDYSAPNIAKPFSIGHLRSTIIGQALYNLYQFLGYRVIGDNHIGDWGTQFGKLMYAFITYGDAEVVNQNPIPELLNLYVKFHEEAERNPALNDEGRKWFKKLEQGDPEARQLWQWFTELSWQEFQKLYDLLGGITFDEVLGESFYNDKLQATLQEALKKTLAVFRGQEEYQAFFAKFPQTRALLEARFDSLEVRLAALTVTDKALKALQTVQLPDEIVQKLEQIKNQTMFGQKRVTELLASWGLDEKQQKEIVKRIERKTIQQTLLWCDLWQLSEQDMAQIGTEAMAELRQHARPLVTWGAINADELEAVDLSAVAQAGEDSEQQSPGSTLRQAQGIAPLTNRAAAQQIALIHLDEFGLETPLLIQKSDGTSLYATRDLATAEYRIQRWQPEKMLYVVGGEQQLYFQQWLTALRLMGYKTPCKHVWFGLIRLPEGKMSTRKGRVIFLEDVLSEAISRAENILKDREMGAEEKQAVARMVGVGALKYADLSQERTKEVVFDWEKMLNMQGNSAPYLQYAYVRIQSILRKAEEAIDPDAIDATLLMDASEKALLKEIARFPEIVQSAAEECAPHIVAGYLFGLAQVFSGYYNAVSIIHTAERALRQTRLYLCQMSAQVLKTGLGLLGIECPERM